MEVFSFEQKDFTRQKKSVVGFVLLNLHVCYGLIVNEV